MCTVLRQSPSAEEVLKGVTAGRLCSDVPICSKAFRTHPQLYARKFLFYFPESELIESNNASGAKEPRASIAQMQKGLSACWGTNGPTVHCSPEIDPGMRALALVGSIKTVGT